MPRLGSDDEEEGIPLMPVGNRRRNSEATAYAASSSSGLQASALKLVLVLVAFLVVRNMLSHDYREDAREYLKMRAGKSDEEIDRYYVPRTIAERRQAALGQQSEAERLQQTVAQLQKQVDQLQWKVFGTNETEKMNG